MAEPGHEPEGIIRKLLPFTTVGVILAAIYVGYVFYSRWSENREIAEKARQQQLLADQRTVNAYGGGHVKVLSFNITPGVIDRGEKVSICYGVANAKSVTIDPKPEDDVWPSLARCVDAMPKKDTTYTITAKDENGQTDSKSLEVKVR